MVQRDQLYTYWGRKNLFFLIRAFDNDATMAAAPVESCQSVALRSPWGRLGSVLYTCKRLHRTRRRFQHISANSLSSAAHKTMNYLANGFQSSRRAPRIGACGTGDYPPPDLPRETSRSRSAPEKSVQFGPDGAPFPSKTPITLGPPGIVIAVSLDPMLPHRC